MPARTKNRDTGCEYHCSTSQVAVKLMTQLWKDVLTLRPTFTCCGLDKTFDFVRIVCNGYLVENEDYFSEKQHSIKIEHC